MLLTPLEQFQIISFMSMKMFCLDFSLTNMLFINIIVLIFSFVFSFFQQTNSGKSSSLFLIPKLAILFETVYEVVSQLVFDNLNEEGEKYFPFISVIFTFILFNNLIGLVPYSFTITSHLIVTFILSFSIFIGVMLICVSIIINHKCFQFFYLPILHLV